MKRLIFVVEDDADISRLIRHHLEGAGYAVRVFSTADAAMASALKEAPSLFLLDIMLPGGSGIDFCRDLRSNSGLAGVPIVFVTARGGEADRVHGFDVGADDYISKPFSPRELVARVKAVLRRFERPLPVDRLDLGDLVIDTGAMTLTVRGETVATTATEFRLLDYFARHPRRVFSRGQLLDAVWPDSLHVTQRSIDVYVRRLREKIERDPEQPQLLRTVRGAGYRFEAPR